jgi:hypothetical protein
MEGAMNRSRVSASVSTLLVLALGCKEPVADVGEISGSAGTDPASTSEAGGDASSGVGPSDATTTPADATTLADDDGSDDADELPLLDVEGEDPPPLPGCEGDIGQYIYLLDVDAGLHRIAPATLELETLGPLACPGVNNAMALTVARDGILWAMMVDDEGFRTIHTIDSTTLDCEDSGFIDPIDEQIFVNTLAFVADAPDGETESLYVGANVGGSFDFEVPLSLGRVDLTTMELDIVGTAELVPTGYYQIADLTGTGDSRMWGFFAGDTAAIAELDEQSSSVIEHDLLDFGVGSPWAFAQWEGRLWLFSSGGDPGSDIRAWNPANGVVEQIHPGIGISVVGAAVSTCAPYEPEG